MISFQNPGSFHFDVEDVKNQPIASHPRNPNILKYFRLAKLSENAGYGIEKILNWTNLTGQEVEFKTYSSLSEVIFWQKRGSGTLSGTLNGTLNNEDDKLTELEVKILDFINGNSQATINYIGEATGVNPRTVKRIMAKLQERKLLIREGSKKTGSWKVNIVNNKNN